MRTRPALALVLAPLAATLACADLPTDPAVEPGDRLETRVPGHQMARHDTDGNGFPDEGVEVNGVYTALYAYDGAGDWYWDLGDGRILGTVASPDDLDRETRTDCVYHNQYRGTFGNDPFQDSGWIKNNIRCSGAEKGTYHYVMVHESDPRYTGNPDRALWGSWEYHVLALSGFGNLARPRSHVGG